MMFSDKTPEAKEVIKQCEGTDGFYPSADLYYGQYWMRDPILSLPTLSEFDSDCRIKKGLQKIASWQKESGELPAVIYTRRVFPRGIIPSLRALSSNSFLLRAVWRDLLSSTASYRFRKHPLEIASYHPWTGDNEILFVIGIYELTKKGYLNLGDFKESLEKAIDFIESRTVGKYKLAVGGGWMDAMKNYKGKITLLNNLLLYRMHQLAGNQSRAQELKNVLNSPLFFDKNSGFYYDEVGASRFDAMAHCLAIEWEILHRKNIEPVIDRIDGLLSKNGYRNIDPPYSFKECGQPPYSYQNSASWPIWDAKLVKLMKTLGFDKQAKNGFRIISGRKGYNEWYSPISSRAMGSKKQLWSAVGRLIIEDIF